MAAGALPSSLMHPLRNVALVRFDGGVVRADVCIGIITKASRRPPPPDPPPSPSPQDRGIVPGGVVRRRRPAAVETILLKSVSSDSDVVK